MTERAHGAVVRFVEGELAAGRLAVGQRLPPERALAERLGVSRPLVREGIRVLEALGLVRTAVGSGPDAGAVVTADPAAGFGVALRLHLAASSLPIDDVVDTRVLLESAAVRAAAARLDPAALASARRLLDAMDVPDLGAEGYHELDCEFHLTLVRASGNEVTTAIMASLRDAIRGYVLDGVGRLRDWPAMARRLTREHRALLEAVTAGEPDEAERLVTAHIRGFHRATRPK
jgi:GntR family transcriptional repressor for pyruvate dehydrogenase complex